MVHMSHNVLAIVCLLDAHFLDFFLRLRVAFGDLAVHVFHIVLCRGHCFPFVQFVVPRLGDIICAVLKTTERASVRRVFVEAFFFATVAELGGRPDEVNLGWQRLDYWSIVAWQNCVCHRGCFSGAISQARPFVHDVLDWRIWHVYFLSKNEGSVFQRVRACDLIPTPGSYGG